MMLSELVVHLVHPVLIEPCRFVLVLDILSESLIVGWRHSPIAMSVSVSLASITKRCLKLPRPFR